MADWTKPFEATYRWMRVSRETGYEVATIDNLTDGSLTINQDSSTFESAEVNCIGAIDIGIDYARCYMDATFEDGSTETVCLGTWLASIPSRNVRGSYEDCSVRLDGRLIELNEDSFDAPVVFGNTSTCIEYAKGIVEGCGMTVVMYDDDPGTKIKERWTFGLDGEDSNGGSKLRAVNALLSRAGFRSASTDPYGNVVFRKSVEQPYPVPSWTFTEGINATFLMDAVDERDTTDVCNVVLAVYETDASTTIGEAIDSDPASPYSTVSLTRRKVAKYFYNDEATQIEADARAARLLASNQSVIHRITLSHVYCGLRVGEVAGIDYGSAHISGRYMTRVQTIKIGSAGCITETELRRFERD